MERLDGDGKGKFYTIVGAVQTITYDNNFCYPACDNCRKKLVQAGPEMYRCEKCKEPVRSHSLMYGVHAKVSDGTGSVWIESFGECVEIMLGGCKAEQLMEATKAARGATKLAFEQAKYKVLAGDEAG